MIKPALTPDCTNCAALCCVVFAFDKSESFAVDKAAGEVCANLDGCGRCKVFSKRQELGFKGCIAYDCHGAGQRVTQEVFGGKSWRNDTGLTIRMGAALSVLRRIHEQLVMLRTAGNLPLEAEERLTAQALEESLSPENDWTEGTLQAFPIDAICRDVATFLRGLRHHVTGVNGHN
ncbi:hypothetical protein [Roseibium marinum]|uniref:Pentapeptide repeat-containing protein n=1 Tax=Roseibium marinum TaxID=281252 RepID=A0A2S3UP57_9HYPH|nr:hypothetical protein [Roseibium marinum]POF29454.1 hypothetical protein CLV41_109231 [Roseibium marinum]